MEREFEEGVMWEENPFTIRTEAECNSYAGTPCRHCHSFTKTPKGKRIWINPAIVIVVNEGGYNSTGLCIACLREAAVEMGI